MATSMVVMKRVSLVMVIAIIAVSMSGLGKLRLNSHYTAYFDIDNPSLIAHQRIAELFSREDALFVVLQSPSSFLHAENYRMLEALTATLATQPFTTSVLSITELGITGESLTSNGDILPSLSQLQDDNRAMGLLLSENTLIAGIWVQIKLPDSDAKTLLNTISSIRSAVDAAIGDLPISSHYTGTLALNEAYIDVVRRDLKRIVPLLFAIMIVTLGVLLHSWRAVLIMLPIGIGSVAASFGIAGMFGAELAAINAFVPVIILSIGMAGCVHMALSYNRYRQQGKPAEDAAVAAATYNRLPMSLASGTTALGFIGLTLSPSPPVRLIGYLVGTGIVIAFILCMTLLPVLQARFDPWNSKAKFSTATLNRLADFVFVHRTALIAVFLAISLPAAWLASRNVISDNVFEYFAPTHSFHQATQLVEDNFSGVNEVLYSVETGRKNGFFDADAVEALTRFAAWLRQQPDVNRVVSIADSEVFVEARQQGRLQQRLDFYKDRIESSAPENPLLSLAVSADYSASAITVYLRQLDSKNLIAFDERAHSWSQSHLSNVTVQSGGPALMFAHLGEQNIRGMLTALAVALLAAGIILGAVLRSWRVAWIGLICNLLPVLLVYSVWAVSNGRISIGAAVVMGMILGIVLDDTIYLLTSYRRGAKQHHGDAIKYAMQRVGPALIMTTITLVCGLSVGLMSNFGPIWSMSALSVMIIATALAVDLLLLPALLSTRGIHRGAT